MTPLMKDMDKAVLESKKAIENQERMSIWDYDVDGTTAVSLYLSYLKVIILK
jgi:single-stranded DNA-specific DHH superfamily exonuclease